MNASGPTNMKVSIIICTRNRADSLRLTLASIGHAIVPQGWDVELLLVDNGSTDNTRLVAEKSRLPNTALRYLLEARKGKCHGLNTGIENASGSVLLFTDDDVRVPPGWIEGMCGPIFDGTFDAAGGRVRLADSLVRSWHTPVIKTWLVSGIPSVGDLWGANMAFHRNVLGAVPGYDVQLGPGALGLCDDTLFASQLCDAGFKLGTIDVEVEHHPDVARLTEPDLVKAAIRRGRSFAYCAYHWDRKPERFTVPREMLLRAKRAMRLLVAPRELDPPRMWRIFYTWHISYLQKYRSLQSSPRIYSKRGLATGNSEVCRAEPHAQPGRANGGRSEED